jgi:hypothetical protein
MKIDLQPFLGEKSVMFTDKQGRPPLIAGDVEYVHKLFSSPASITFGPSEQSLIGFNEKTV